MWLYDGHLYVGHEPAACTLQRTLSSLYIEPLERILKATNINSHWRDTPRGVFDMDPNKKLQLLIDFKTDGQE